MLDVVSFLGLSVPLVLQVNSCRVSSCHPVGRLSLLVDLAVELGGTVTAAVDGLRSLLHVGSWQPEERQPLGPQPANKSQKRCVAQL